jgi:hypothetical protein
MLHFVLFDPPMVTGDTGILAGDAPVFLHFGSTAATMSAVFLVFLGVEMALIVSGFTSFHHHNDIVN